MINRAVKEKVTFTSSDADGRIILINLTYNGVKLSYGNTNAPNDHTQQVNFIRELNCLLIDKSEITTLIVGVIGIVHYQRKTKRVVPHGGQLYIGIW